MARSVNIDGFSFQQMSLGGDSIIIEYHDSKADQIGEKTVPKNVTLTHLIHVSVYG